MYAFVLIVFLLAEAVAVFWSVRLMDLFHPLLHFVTPLFFQYVVYLTVYREVFPVRMETLQLLFIICVSFLLGCLLCQRIHPRVKRRGICQAEIYFNKQTLHVFAIIAVSGFLFGVIEMFVNGTNGAQSFFTNVRVNEIYGAGKNFYTKYSVVFLFLTTLITVYCSCRKKQMGKEAHGKIAFLFAVMLLLSTLFTVARTELLTYVFSIACLYDSFSGKRRGSGFFAYLKKYKKFLMLLVLLVTAFYLLGAYSGRGVTSEIFHRDFFLWRYSGYTLVTFDQYCLDKAGACGILSIMGPVGKLLWLLGISAGCNSVVPPQAQYNVTGYVGGVYTAVGSGGTAIFTLAAGYFVMWLYCRARDRGGYFLIFYASYLCTVTMAFFSYQLANTLYFYLAACIVLLNIKPNGKLVRKGLL